LASSPCSAKFFNCMREGLKRLQGLQLQSEIFYISLKVSSIIPLGGGLMQIVYSNILRVYETIKK